LERFAANNVTVLAQHVVVIEALIEEGVFLALGHRLPIVLVKVSKTDVFHVYSVNS
jgi:hypothetical protein